MSDLDEARLLLGKAQKDFMALEGMQNAETFAEEIFGFHAQQAVEKAIKAWIALLGLEYPLVHNIGVLLNVVESAGHEVERFRLLDDFTSFAVQFRYEDINSDDEPVLERAAVVERIREIVEHVRAAVAGHKTGSL